MKIVQLRRFAEEEDKLTNACVNYIMATGTRGFVIGKSYRLEIDILPKLDVAGVLVSDMYKFNVKTLINEDEWQDE
jgi:hypothetical protein